MPACSADSEMPTSGITKYRKNKITMIGMPRSRLMMAALTLASSGMPDTRMTAHTRPSTVDSSKEPSVTRMVSQAPWSRMGMNSRAWCRNWVMGGRFQ